MFTDLNKKGEMFVEAVHYTKDNRKIFIEAHIITIKGEKGDIEGYLTVNRDISNHKLIEQQLRHEKDRFEILADLVAIFAKVTDDYKEALDYTVKKLADKIGDQCVIRLLNDRGDRLVESSFWHNDKDCMEYITNLYAVTAHQPGESFSGETIKNAKPLLIPAINDTTGMKPEYLEYVKMFGLSSMLFVPVESDEKILGTLSMYRNKPGNPFIIEDQMFLQNVAGKIGFAISKAKLFNNLKSALKEKEVLLRELYHRTKNNMQVINSLLGLRKESAQDDSVKMILQDMRNRVAAIALVHQKLYQSKDLSNIDLKEYLKDLINLLISSYSDHNNINLKLDMENISVLIDIAVPLGLIVNELISNSFKHAFPNGMEGEISMFLHRHQNGTIELKISDNGIGIPKGMDILNNETLGVQLLNSIVESQLGGTINLETQNGVTCTIRFNDLLYEERV
jgi:two-component sensor histidine kinase